MKTEIPPGRKPPALSELLPSFSEIVKSADLWFAFGLMVVFGFATTFMDVTKRDEITRKFIELAVPILIGVLAVIIASFAIFGAVVTREMRKLMGSGYDDVVRILFWGITSCVVTLLYAFILYALSYIREFVPTPAFYCLALLAVWMFAYSVIQLFVSGDIAARQLVANRDADG